MRNFTFCLAVLCTALLTSQKIQSQDLRPVAIIDHAKSVQSFEESYPLFSFEKNNTKVDELDAAGADYEVFNLDLNTMTTLHKSEPALLELDLPRIGKVALAKASIFADGFRVTESGSNTYTKAPLGLHYRGVVNGDKSSLVAISVFEGEVSGLIATDDGNFVLGRLTDKNDGTHILYNDKDLPAPDLGECTTVDSSLPYSAKDLADLDTSQKDADNCVNLYLEADYSIFEQRGSAASVTSFVTGLFNQVAILYANENINLVLSELYIWTDQDPYNRTSASDNLDDFKNTRRSFNGDIAQLVSFQSSGGIAYVNVLCSSYFNYGFSSIRNKFNNVPTYSWSVYVLAHELGHNFGSQHTHVCVWNGDNTPIDGCYVPVGGCDRPADLPAGGGTIMSYCHLNDAGINFNKGFGTQPGNLIRNRAYNGTCLVNCSTPPPGDDGGNDDADCTANEITITLRTDNYPQENGWTLTNAAGSTVASDSSFTSRGTIYQEVLCLPDGCYTFTITDSYGDGICCRYGSGSYSISVNGSDVAAGGSFASSVSQNFCAQSTHTGGGGDGGDDFACVSVDFTDRKSDSYAGLQDIGTIEVLNPTRIRLMNNAWKSIPLDYTITANTILEFDFGSTVEGEIHGIGFDNDDRISFNYTFQLYGSQYFGIPNFRDYPVSGSMKSFTIPVGEFYTGTFDRMFFVMDHDGGRRNGNSYFCNIRIYEGDDCTAIVPADGELIGITPETQASLPVTESVNVFPNPASDQLNLNVTLPVATDAVVRIVDVTGRTVSLSQLSLRAGEQRIPLIVTHLPAGTYYLRLDAGSGYSATSRFVVAR